MLLKPTPSTRRAAHGHGMTQTEKLVGAARAVFSLLRLVGEAPVDEKVSARGETGTIEARSLRQDRSAKTTEHWMKDVDE